MEVLKENKVLLPVIFFLIIQNYVSSEIFFIIGLMYMIYYIIFKEKGKVYIPFREYKILMLFLVWGTTLGIVYFINEDNRKVMDLVRDIFYYLNPLVYIYIGTLYSKREVNIYEIFNSLIIAGGILCFIELINMWNNVSGILSSFSVETWRRASGAGVITSSISLAIIFSGIIPKDKRISSSLNCLCTIIMILDFIMTLSRTNLLILLITYLILILDKSNAQKILKNLLVIMICIVAFVFIIFKFFPIQIKEAYINKILGSFSEISSEHDWSKVSEIQGNWRGYETYCALNQWKKSPLLKQTLGEGLGKRIYVGKYAYTLLYQTDSDGLPTDSIAVLHNGYSTMLIKQGILGVFLYVMFYLFMIYKGIKGIRKYNDISSRILLAVSLSLAIQTYFLNGLYKDYCFYPLIILLGYTAFNMEKLKKNREK